MQIITIKGNPISKLRPRFARIGKGVRTYSAQKTEEGMFLCYVMDKLGNIEPDLDPITLHLGFYMKRPKSHYGTGRNIGKVKKSAPKLHIKKPDLDNLIKFVMDCLNEYLWKDDSQVFQILAFKTYSDNPRTEIKWIKGE